MRDPAFRILLVLVVSIVVLAVVLDVLLISGAPRGLGIAVLLVGTTVTTIWALVQLQRTPPIAAPSMPVPSGSEGAVYDERVVSIFRHEWFGTKQALRVTVTGGSLSVAWDGRFSHRFGQFATKSGAMGTGLGFSVAVHDIVSARRRRLLLPQFIWEMYRPHQGLGLTGEWKFRVRGVRSGVAIRTKSGLKAWIATRQPDEMLSSLSETGRAGAGGTMDAG